MEITCPACRKINACEDQCSRCGADLTLLIRVSRAAARRLAIGQRLLHQNDGVKALQAAQAAWDLKHSPAAAQLAFLACLLQGQFPEARRWYARAVGRL